ncbi:unnamed protein product [Protopolystoma xenopodis]|uniref:GPR180/TMEM145 transmembrane domain-containing protein n=1 Tax=Protopolystoma xenopodis TaxID=117903 RepID=A0A3S5CRM1_9PLAT|nr:unnamed protein product [Protopolystoma xenopodis]
MSNSGEHHTPSLKPISYDIWLVNGLPDLKTYNKFEHQFSFEDHDTLELFLVIGLLYLILALIVQTRFVRLNTPLSVILSFHLWLSTFGALLVAIHLGIFSADGLGVEWLSSLGTVVTRWAEALFLLLLVATARVGFSAPSLQDPPPPLLYFLDETTRFRRIKEALFSELENSRFPLEYPKHHTDNDTETALECNYTIKNNPLKLHNLIGQMGESPTHAAKGDMKVESLNRALTTTSLLITDDHKTKEKRKRRCLTPG